LTTFVVEPSFRTRVYDALKRAITEIDIYSSTLSNSERDFGCRGI